MYSGKKDHNMEDTLFKPYQMALPQHLILIPQFWDKKYHNKLKDSALGKMNIAEGELLLFNDFTIITGFLGYPQLLTILEFVEDVREKDVYFLGTAGSLNEAINEPMPLQIKEIFSTALLDHFCLEKQFDLKLFDSSQMKIARGVTVDIIQRETIPWLREQKSNEMDFVEMEIFPLRAYLGKPFHAIVVTSDILRETGVDVFKDKQKLREEFIKAYEFIIGQISL